MMRIYEHTQPTTIDEAIDLYRELRTMYPNAHMDIIDITKVYVPVSPPHRYAVLMYDTGAAIRTLPYKVFQLLTTTLGNTSLRSNNAPITKLEHESNLLIGYVITQRQIAGTANSAPYPLRRIEYTVTKIDIPSQQEEKIDPPTCNTYMGLIEGAEDLITIYGNVVDIANYNAINTLTRSYTKHYGTVNYYQINDNKVLITYQVIDDIVDTASIDISYIGDGLTITKLSHKPTKPIIEEEPVHVTPKRSKQPLLSLKDRYQQQLKKFIQQLPITQVEVYLNRLDHNVILVHVLQEILISNDTSQIDTLIYKVLKEEYNSYNNTLLDNLLTTALTNLSI